MENIILWGTRVDEKASGIEPYTFQKMFSRPEMDFTNACSWKRASLIAEGAVSKCWVSSTAVEQTLLVTGPCSSSMDLAWYFNRKNLLPEWGSVLAVSQWAGKGQLGRAWYSPVGNIYGALHLPVSALRHSDHLSLLVGYMLVAGLMDVGVEAKLKWPNDLIIDNRKVGGILVEQKGDTCMVGVGINLASCPGKVKIRSQQSLPSACLTEFGIDMDPLSLWRHLVKTGQSIFNTLIMSEVPDVMATLGASLAFIGDHALVEDYKGELYEATILGLSPDGGLRLSTKSGIHITRSASIYPLTT
jgi:BirA family biotin operon repressor/biotin-[acetyl-CoA-carboxylase] ligase